VDPGTTEPQSQSQNDCRTQMEPSPVNEAEPNERIQDDPVQEPEELDPLAEFEAWLRSGSVILVD
jgi:hypothetical protein